VRCKLKLQLRKNKVLLQWKNVKIISAYVESTDLISCIIKKNSKIWWDSPFNFGLDISSCQYNKLLQHSFESPYWRLQCVNSCWSKFNFFRISNGHYLIPLNNQTDHLWRRHPTCDLCGIPKNSALNVLFFSVHMCVLCKTFQQEKHFPVSVLRCF
jgi:hypothetical protein